MNELINLPVTTDEFWEANLPIVDVARLLNTSRQNIHQRIKRKSIPVRLQGDLVGVPEEWVLETIRMRERDKEKRDAKSR